MKVKEAMHRGVDWVSPDTPLTELAKLMCEHDIGAIPIGENDRLIGMVTDRDIVCKGLAQDGFDIRRANARDVMTPGIHCCREDDDLVKAVRHMEMLKVRRLPVINKGKRLQVQLVSRLGGDELHRRALHRLGNRFGVAEVVLLTFGIRPHVFRRHQACVVTVRLQLAAQVVSANASLKARWRVGKPRFKLATRPFLAEYERRVHRDR
jgi:CBS domain-containing protein